MVARRDTLLSFADAGVDILDQIGVGRARTIELQARPVQQEFPVTWNAPGQINVSFAAVDSYGDWNSFVGGGPRSY